MSFPFIPWEGEPLATVPDVVRHYLQLTEQALPDDSITEELDTALEEALEVYACVEAAYLTGTLEGRDAILFRYAHGLLTASTLTKGTLLLAKVKANLSQIKVGPITATTNGSAEVKVYPGLSEGYRVDAYRLLRRISCVRVGRVRGGDLPGIAVAHPTPASTPPYPHERKRGTVHN